MKKLLFSFFLLGIVGVASAQTTPPDTTKNKPVVPGSLPADTTVPKAMKPVTDTSATKVGSMTSTSNNNAADSTATAAPVADSTAKPATGVPAPNPTDAKIKSKTKMADGNVIKVKTKDGRTKVKGDQKENQ
ncbi:hypothetical protein [Flavisolibacter nicotianae]|uniref:hypothetical protein n=1 Tax=Flavisolibacter nicotianae TaxID=2364882 RepID=UPI000EABDD6D|nr:hypothetical protein [Flavisolibacter nicotianae]